MLPYLIAGAIGFGIAKLFEDDETPKYDDGGKLADNIFDYLQKKGFEPLGNGLRSKSNCTIKMDFSNVLYQAKNDNRVWVSPIEYSDYKKAFSILEFHCRDKNKGIGTSVLEEIIQGADLFGYTIFIEPTSMKKYRVETDINTNDLKRWYSKYDFKPINDNYSDYVWLRSPKNPDIRFDDGGYIKDSKIIHSHSFINSKGNEVDQYKLTDGYGGYIRVEHYSDGFVITNIILDERLRRKGLATEFYKKINEESIKETGKTLQSIKRDSDGIIELSDNGKNLWESLVKKGLAIKISKNKYRFKK